MLPGLRKTLPNAIDPVQVPGYSGMIGLVACPGVRISKNIAGNKKLIGTDLNSVQEWRADVLVSLLEEHELERLKVTDLPKRLQNIGISWMHLPIRDMGIPDQKFEDGWALEGERLRFALRHGERVVFHCYAGLGRTGMIAARLLVELGTPPEQAIQAVRSINPRRIQTREQEVFVYSCVEIPPTYE